MSLIPNPNAQPSVLNTIHQVEGFDPSVYAVPYTDLNSGETRKRLPVMAQMAWFRLVYPEGKIAVSVVPSHDCFIATARIYPSYKDPVDCFLAEATASRGYDPSKPSVSPREWAQTAAVGIALRNASHPRGRWHARGVTVGAGMHTEYRLNPIMQITPTISPT